MLSEFLSIYCLTHAVTLLQYFSSMCIRVTCSKEFLLTVHILQCYKRTYRNLYPIQVIAEQLDLIPLQHRCQSLWNYFSGKHWSLKMTLLGPGCDWLTVYAKFTVKPPLWKKSSSHPLCIPYKIRNSGLGCSSCNRDPKFPDTTEKIYQNINSLQYQDHSKPFFIEIKILTIISLYIGEKIWIILVKQQPPLSLSLSETQL